MKKRKNAIHVSICFLVGIYFFAMVALPITEGQALQKPVRLGLYAIQPNIDVGEATVLVVQFRDLDNMFVANDRNRTVDIEVTSGSQGMGRISPKSIEVKAGAKEARTSFQAQRAGVVILQAKSQGLEPNNAYIGVRPRSSGVHQGFHNLLKALIAPRPSYAQPPQNTQAQLLLNLAFDKVPANGVTPVEFGLYLSAALPEAQEVRFRTEGPPVRILINGNEQRITQIKKGDLLPAGRTELIPGMEVGWTTIIATAYPAQIRVEERIELVSPKPTGLLVNVFPPRLVADPFFPPERATIDVQLVDSHKGRVQENTEDRVVTIRTSHPSAVAEAGEFEIRKNQIRNSTALVLRKKLGLPERVSIVVRDKNGIIEGDDDEVQILPLTTLLIWSGLLGAVLGGIKSYLRKGQKQTPPTQRNPGIIVSTLVGAVAGVLAWIGVILGVWRVAEIDIPSLVGTGYLWLAAMLIGGLAGYSGEAFIKSMYLRQFPDTAHS